ncbi:DUF4199 domain-containing protein [uncultured Mucilaginibacter sp.]|uniref:DUF4199 domain-containing protein n=1 Tax=uncultured Mucilaginibacter sp. TaxID=797541 RepID=UPI00260FA00B|nr:DUF4199 domain-containing protein [uncultured Mucilaginibacter sp.]
MQDLNRQIRIQGAIYGGVLGVLILVLHIASYLVMVKVSTPLWVTAFSPLIFTNVLPIIAAVLLCLNLREKIGGYWHFRQAASGIFVMFLVSYLIFFFGFLLFSKVIEPATDLNLENKIEATKAAIRQQQGVSLQHIQEETKGLRKDFTDRQNSGVWGFVQSFGIVVVLLFLASMIFGALFKNDPPVYAPSNKTH